MHFIVQWRRLRFSNWSYQLISIDGVLSKDIRYDARIIKKLALMLIRSQPLAGRIPCFSWRIRVLMHILLHFKYMESTPMKFRIHSWGSDWGAIKDYRSYCGCLSMRDGWELLLMWPNVCIRHIYISFLKIDYFRLLNGNPTPPFSSVVVHVLAIAFVWMLINI